MEENWLWKYLTSLGRDEIVVVAAMTIATTIWAYFDGAPTYVLISIFIGVAAFALSFINALQGRRPQTKREQSEAVSEPPAKNLNRTLRDFLTPSIILIGLVLFILIANSFVKGDRKTKRELEGELVAAEEHIGRLAGKLPPPTLPPDQQSCLIEALRRRGPFRVFITYLDSTDSRPGGYAGHLQKIFIAASWKTNLQRGTWPRRSREGLNIRIDPHNGPTPQQQAVIEAFQEAGVPLGRLVSGDDVIERIELVVGVM